VSAGRARLAAPATRYAGSYVAALHEGFYRGAQPVVTARQIRAIEADFARHVARITEQTGTIRLPNGELAPKVPFSLRWLVEGEEFIGEVSLRHQLNPWLLQEGGHIGYGIRPSRRHPAAPLVPPGIAGPPPPLNEKPLPLPFLLAIIISPILYRYCGN
jgi:predicted acetyltransferase